MAMLMREYCNIWLCCRVQPGIEYGYADEGYTAIYGYAAGFSQE